MKIPFAHQDATRTFNNELKEKAYQHSIKILTLKKKQINLQKTLQLVTKLLNELTLILNCAARIDICCETDGSYSQATD